MIGEFFHQFFYFLGTVQGEFFHRSIESFVYSIITYMIISEYLRSREPEQKVLIFAFAALSIQKLIMTFNLAMVLFANQSTKIVFFYMPLFDDFLEMCALILLANAFLFPIMKEQKRDWQSYLKNELLFLVVLSLFIEAFWIFSIRRNANLQYPQFVGSPLFDILNIAILLIPIYYWIFHPPNNRIYRVNILLAFALYMAYPVLGLLNFIIYNNSSVKMFVAMHPFPLIAVLLFMRVVYLKLVDKANIKEKLKESERKYYAEKEVSEMKDEFISTVSHELRTPLTSMKLYICLLRDGEFGAMNSEQVGALSTIKEESDRLTGLIEDILDLSKLESKKSKLLIQRHDIKDIIQSDLYDKLAREKGIEIIKIIPKSFLVLIDGPKFKQVFVNLFSNAVKFTDKGSITITAKMKKKTWELSLQDTGRGIAKEDIPKLFGKFYQAQDYMTRTQSGTGLGLAIAKKIVELHKGKISVESALGVGSTFTVTMPIRQKKSN